MPYCGGEKACFALHKGVAKAPLCNRFYWLGLLNVGLTTLYLLFLVVTDSVDRPKWG
jgi:hypothetical protein